MGKENSVGVISVVDYTFCKNRKETMNKIVADLALKDVTIALFTIKMKISGVILEVDTSEFK